MEPSAVPAPPSPAEASALRAVLHGAGFTTAGVRGWDEAPEYPEAGPLGTLRRLFLAEEGVAQEVARRALEPVPLEEWARLGLLRREGTEVRAPFRLAPHGTLLVLSDWLPDPGAPAGQEIVTEVSPASRMLAGFTPRRPVRRTLDLGTGQGIQALLAARHSDYVLATDRNPRATRVAAFNAALNGFPHVECAEGDLFQPARGRRFDLVVSNPPFVISPEARYLFRDSGMEGDALCRTIARDVAPLLEEGGICQILCNWAHMAGEDWRERLAGWVRDTGCDAWVLRWATLESDAYAEVWLVSTEAEGPQARARRLEEWRAHYRRLGITAVSAGLITLRRRGSGSPWFRTDDWPEKRVGAAGEQILRRFTGRDFLDAHPGDRFLTAVLAVAPEVRLEPETGRVAFTRGLAYAESVPVPAAAAAAACDGTRSLAAIFREQGAEPGPETLDALRRLVAAGYLAPGE